MTLLFFKNNKLDNRMVEYDQAVVRLGLEKAGLESEAERKRKDIKQLDISRSLILESMRRDREAFDDGRIEELEEKATAVVDYEDRVAKAQKELSVTEEKKSSLGGEISVAEKRVGELSESIADLEKVEMAKKEGVSLVEIQKAEKNKEIQRLNQTLSPLKEQERKQAAQNYELALKRKETEDAIEASNNELTELNDIISVLQANNKQGLELVSSFEGERKRLQEKDEFLIRKEKDLQKYEERLEKGRKEMGNNNPMTFK